MFLLLRELDSSASFVDGTFSLTASFAASLNSGVVSPKWFEKAGEGDWLRVDWLVDEADLETLVEFCRVTYFESLAEVFGGNKAEKKPSELRSRVWPLFSGFGSINSAALVT